MNANTALKINDAVDQAIRCGESVDDVLGQVKRALDHALEARHERLVRKASREVFADVRAEIRRSRGI